MSSSHDDQAIYEPEEDMSEAHRNTDRNRSPDEIERELEDERAKLRETVETVPALQR